jgi:hypothetical protein
MRETNRIDVQAYTSYLPYHPLYDYEYQQNKDAIKLEYLNAYYDNLRK